MPGIIVGVDGSGHSQRALGWAMKEAAIRHTPLTVLTVAEAVKGYYGGVANYPDDAARTEQAREAAQAETDKVLAGLEGPHPEAVTVKAVHGFPVNELIDASKDANMVFWARGGGRIHPADDWIGRWPGHPACALPGAHRPARGPRLNAACRETVRA